MPAGMTTDGLNPKTAANECGVRHRCTRRHVRRPAVGPHVWRRRSGGPSPSSQLRRGRCYVRCLCPGPAASSGLRRVRRRSAGACGGAGGCRWGSRGRGLLYGCRHNRHIHAAEAQGEACRGPPVIGGLVKACESGHLGVSHCKYGTAGTVGNGSAGTNIVQKHLVQSSSYICQPQL